MGRKALLQVGMDGVEYLADEQIERRFRVIRDRRHLVPGDLRNIAADGQE